jgi:hypothetical protein
VTAGLSERAAAAFPISFAYPLSNELALSVPPQIDAAIDMLRTACANGEARQAAVLEWLKRMTSLGQNPPPPSPAGPEEPRRVRQRRGAIVRYAPLSSEQIAVGADGHVFTAARSDDVIGALKSLAAGEALSLAGAGDAVSRVCQELWNARAVEASP